MAGRKQATGLAGLALGLALLAALLAGAPFYAGALAIAQHEGDALHLADLVLRMAELGQTPHRDFLTPIGIGALWPVAAFVQAGLGFGHAFMAAQALVLAVLFLPILRAAQSRFPGALAWLFAAYVAGLCVALLHGEADTQSSLSMHYNRWAWAMAYVALPLAMLEPLAGVRRPWLDGALIGAMMAGLVLVKVTYFAAFAPVVVLALLVRRDGATLAVALAVGLAVLGAITVRLGLDFWPAYLHDLMTVAGSDNRAAPGESFAGILAAPQNLAATLLLLAAVVFLRQAGEMTGGLLLLALTPAFAYVTYQNFGNDPQWLVLLALLALALRPEGAVSNGFGWRLRDALLCVGVGALVLGSGSAMNLVWSPLRHAFAKTEGMVPLLSARPADADLLVWPARLYKAEQLVRADGPGQPYAAFAEKGAVKIPQERPKPQSASLNGEELPNCEMSALNALFEQQAADLAAAGYGGKAILSTDLFAVLWLFGPFKPVRGEAPWYYGGAPGMAQAELVLVPLCPNNREVRASMLEAIDKQGWRLIEERRSETYILLRPERAAPENAAGAATPGG